MINLQKSQVVARGRFDGSHLTLRLSGIALMVALLAGCDNSVAQNSAPPAPQVSAADVLIKSISQWDAFN
ncbi:MAG: efflux transporter periplasmic adaptor subunit, partial [Sphingobacteriaceae bacterium]